MNFNPGRNRVIAKALALLLAAGAFTGVSYANDDETVVTVAIGGTEAEPFANGNASYRVRPDQQKLEIEVEDLRNTDSVEFVVDGVSLGTATVSLGQANVELESENGPVPVLTAASQVIVADASTGDIIAASGNVIVDDDDEGQDDNGGSSEGDDEGDARERCEQNRLHGFDPRNTLLF